MPGVERSFSSFPAAADEATLSRIFAGQHFLSLTLRPASGWAVTLLILSSTTS
jgi:hypothetical protein